MKTIAILQARMGSTRLSGKVLKPLGSTTVLDYAVSRCKAVKGLDRVIVATSDEVQDNQIEDWCHENNIEVFRGSENDVLTRYYECAKKYQPDYIIRALGDCPFFNYDLANIMLRSNVSRDIDFITFSSSIPLGFGVEIVSYSALKYMNKNGKEPYHREHVTYYGYENPSEFNFLTLEPPAHLIGQQIRMTLDTEDDYKLIKKVADYFYNDKLVSIESIISYLNECPELKKINAHIDQKKVR